MQVCFFFAVMMCVGSAVRYIVWERESQNSMVRLLVHIIINFLSGNATLYISVVINFSGNERNGIEAMEKYSGLVHNIFRRAIDRDDLHFSDFTRWKNPSTIRSSLNTYFTFRLHLFDCYFLVRNKNL